MRHPSQSARPEAAIDWYTFLGRPRLTAPTAQTLHHLSKASILITGAGGSIGSALSRKLVALQPQKLVLLESSEQALYQLLKALQEDMPQADITTVLGSVTDAALVEETLATHKPNILFHAAAYKHVALLEQHPLAAIANNTLGTDTVTTLAKQHGVERLVLLSTDKAVMPTSILGASKRVAELITLASSGVVLRLCNVLETSGNVIETFLQQIHSGTPLTIVHRKAERYFITLEEAVDLLLKSANSYCPGTLFVPAISQSHKITSLATYLSTVYSASTSIPFQFIGMRPGDKLNETLWATEETPIPSPTEGLIPLRHATQDPLQLAQALKELTIAITAHDLHSTLRIVQLLVPRYTPSSRILGQLQNSAQGEFPA